MKGWLVKKMICVWEAALFLGVARGKRKWALSYHVLARKDIHYINIISESKTAFYESKDAATPPFVISAMREYKLEI